MIELNDDQKAIRDGVAAICKRFDDEYWGECEREARFPREFHRAMAADGWLGVTMPEEFGGAGLGVTEAALVMHTVAGSGGAMAAASSIHINMFGPHPIVVHGSAEQKERWLPRLVSGEDQVCFGVVRRQNIWHRSRRKLAECGPRLLLGFRRRAYGVASADVQWSVA